MFPNFLRRPRGPAQINCHHLGGRAMPRGGREMSQNGLTAERTQAQLFIAFIKKKKKKTFSPSNRLV